MILWSSYMQRFLILIWITAVVQLFFLRENWACHCEICSLTDRLTNKIQKVILLNVQVVLIARIADFQNMYKAASEGFCIEF